MGKSTHQMITFLLPDAVRVPLVGEMCARGRQKIESGYAPLDSRAVLEATDRGPGIITQRFLLSQF